MYTHLYLLYWDLVIWRKTPRTFFCLAYTSRRVRENTLKCVRDTSRMFYSVLECSTVFWNVPLCSRMFYSVLLCVRDTSGMFHSLLMCVRVTYSCLFELFLFHFLFLSWDEKKKTFVLKKHKTQFYHSTVQFIIILF